MELTPFDFDGEALRTLVGEDGEPRFVAGDAAKILGYSATAALTRSLDDDEKGVQILHTLGGEQSVTVITESGLYSAILRSRVEGAKRFKRWVTREVIPAIRRTGRYDAAAALPQDYPSALRALADSAEALASSRAALEAAAPKAHAWDEFMSADGDYSVNQAAKSLSRRSGTIIGETRLWRWLAEQKWTYRDHSGPRAYQRRVDAGLLVEKPHSTYIDPKTGEVKARGVQVRVTPKGLERIDRDLNGQFELDVEGAAS